MAGPPSLQTASLAGCGSPAAGVAVHGGRGLLRVCSRQQHGVPSWLGEQLSDDGRALIGGLARAVDRLEQTLTQRAMVVHPGEADVGERQAS